jgi:hypothetical protein
MKEWIAQFLALFIFALWEKYLANNPSIRENSTVDLILSIFKRK